MKFSRQITTRFNQEIAFQAFLKFSLVFCFCSSLPAQSWDFRHTLLKASQEDAEKYVVEKKNVKVFMEDFNTKVCYWGVVKNDAPATLTFRFPLKGPTESAVLNTNMMVANFQNANALGRGRGSGTLWCSPDGREWTLLKTAESPTDKAVDLHVFINKLPSVLKDSREIWLQVRMNATDMTDPDYSVAQFARNLHHNDPKMVVFDLRVKYRKNPETKSLAPIAPQNHLPNP